MNRYNLMEASEVRDEEDNEQFPDILTMDLSAMEFLNPLYEHSLSEVEIRRPDNLMFKAYRTPKYEDIILWLNDVFLRDLQEAGDSILLPNLTDIQRFFRKNRVN